MRPEPIRPSAGFAHNELLVLAVVAGGAGVNDDSHLAEFTAKREAEGAGLTALGFNLALRRLTFKGLIQGDTAWSEQSGEAYPVLKITNNGWDVIEENQHLFTLSVPPAPAVDDDNIPF